MNFQTLPGNESVKMALNSLWAAGRLPHAILLTGAAGSGRRSLARTLAAACVCAGRGDAPCGVCRPCKKALGGIHPDIAFLEGAGRAGSLHIDAIRGMIATAYILPGEAAQKVYILAGAEDLTPQAQNALLKILEEPPAFCRFILTAEDAPALLPTLLSRCTVFALASPEAAEDAPEALACAARMLAAMTERGALPLLRATAPLEKDKALTRAALLELYALLRDAMAQKASGATAHAPEAVERAAARLTLPRLAALLRATEDFLRAMDGNANQTLLITCLSARCFSIAQGG